MSVFSCVPILILQLFVGVYIVHFKQWSVKALSNLWLCSIVMSLFLPQHIAFLVCSYGIPCMKGSGLPPATLVEFSLSLKVLKKL